MKKVLLILLCMLLIGAVAFSASAEGSSVTITPTNNTLERGATFTITADLTNTEEINLCSVVLTFDTSVFELTGGSYYEGGAYGKVAMNGSVAAGTFMLGSATKLSGQVFTFEFKVKDNAALGTYTFTPTASIGENAHIPASGTTVTVACNHSYSAWADAGNGQHQKVCSKCGDTKQEAHDWNDGVGKPAPTCTESGTIEYTCLICQATKTEPANAIGHKYDNDCDDTCNNNCGTTREVTHNYVLVNTNSEGHWYECTVCEGMKPGSWEAHTPGEEATADTAQVCTVCEYVIKQALGHQDVWEEGWTTDSVYHWHRCQTKKCYNVTAKAKHDYDNDCDVDCNTCGYIRVAPHNYKPEWQANAQGHWQICADCNVKSEVYEHEPGPEATMDTPQICTECNIVIKRELSHEHNYGDAWYSDDNSHWQSCSECQEATELEPHAWDEGVELEDGKLQYTCSVCEKQIVTDAQIETEPSTEPSLPQATEPTDSGSFPWQWAGIAAIVLLIVGIVLLVIEFIRSRKTNMHGKFSK